MMRLHELVAGLPGVRVDGNVEAEISDLSLDSRRVGPGALFAALSGAKLDGRRFIPHALERGAVAVLGEGPRPEPLPDSLPYVQADDARATLALLARRLFSAPDEHLALVGITGTDGKTTTAHLARRALEESGISCALAGTLGLQAGSRREDLGLTTPEAPDLWRFLDQSRRDGFEAAALEISSVAIEARRALGLRLRAAVLTTLGHDHLDIHGTVERYHRAKRRLFESLEPDALAILPSDLPQTGEFASATRARVETYGEDEGATWRVSDHEARARGARFRLRGPSLDEEVESKRPAPWDARNLAAAVAAAVGLGADPQEALRGAASAPAPPGRWEIIDEGQRFPLIVDYAHTPDALERALGLLRRTTPGRVIVVFGCGGERDGAKRAEMGRIAACLANLVIVTDDNPRDEDPEEIAGAILAGAAAGPATVERIAGRREAIVRAVRAAGPEDALLVAGKGHEDYQEIAGRRHHFDDREESRAALRMAGGVS